jgi:hypothetical protein
MLTGRYVPNEEERSRTFSMTLPNKILRHLDKISRDRNISRSFFVRQLILNEIENQKKGLPSLRVLGANQDPASEAAEVPASTDTTRQRSLQEVHPA